MKNILSFKLPPVFMRILGAAFFGALATLAFAPFSYWPVALISVTAFLLLLYKQPAPNAAKIGYAWGLGQFGTGISWVHISIDTFGGMPKIASVFLMAMLIGYLALFPALFGYLLGKAKEKAPKISPSILLLLLSPALWLCIDWFRGWFLTGFPWLWLGYSQIESPLSAFAPVFGVQGVTLAVLLLCGSAALAIARRRAIALLPAVAVVCATLLAGNTSWVTPEPEKEADVAMVQGNVAQELKWLPSQRWPTLLNYQDMTRQNWDADIVIWPEAAVPALERELPDFLTRLDNAALNNNTAIITGVLDQDKQERFFNNVITLGENGTGGYTYPAPQSYSKHHLLVFGEFVPFGDFLRPLAPFFNLPMSSFTRGEFTQPNLDANGYQLAPALCYEIAFNEQVRASMTPDTDFILTLSNDAWFGRSIGPHQHLEIARMRALEHGKPVLRATNTGLTAIIDHTGAITADIPQFKTDVLRGTVTPTSGQTPYTRYGEWPLYGLVILAFMVSGLSAFRQRNVNSVNSGV